MLTTFKEFSPNPTGDLLTDDSFEFDGTKVKGTTEWAQAVAVLGIKHTEYTADIDAPGVNLIVVMKHGTNQDGEASWTAMIGSYYIFDGGDLWLPVAQHEIDLAPESDQKSACKHTPLTTEHQKMFKIAMKNYLNSEQITMATMSNDETATPFSICRCAL